MGLLWDELDAAISAVNPFLTAQGPPVPLCALCDETGLCSLSKSSAPVNPDSFPLHRLCPTPEMSQTPLPSHPLHNKKSPLLPSISLVIYLRVLDGICISD